MHRGDGYVTSFTASGVVYDMQFAAHEKTAKFFRAQQTVLVNNIP